MKRALVLAGASGVGKTSVADEILNKCSDFRFIRSVTTRAPRGDGHDGEYIYLDEAEFLKKARKGDFLEYMNYGGNFYGTPFSELSLAFSEEKTPLLILDLEGVKSLRAKNYGFEPYIVYIYEELEVIEKRLLKRGTRDACLKRMAANKSDYIALPEISDKFDIFVKNSDVNAAADEVLSLFTKAHVKNLFENKRIAEALRLTAME